MLQIVAILKSTRLFMYELMRRFLSCIHHQSAFLYLQLFQMEGRDRGALYIYDVLIMV